MKVYKKLSNGSDRESELINVKALQFQGQRSILDNFDSQNQGENF